MINFTNTLFFAILVHFSVPEIITLRTSSEKNVEKENIVSNVTSLANLLNFYNIELLTVRWGVLAEKISPNCKRDVSQYINAHTNREQWALKMDDATGRYSTGWYWGNHFWTGSRSLCENIPVSKKVVNLENQVQIVPKIKRFAPSTTLSPSQAIGYVPGNTYDDPSPFPVSFLALRVKIKSNVTNQEKILQYGMCLPASCNPMDAQTILEETANASGKVTLFVESVRPRQHEFIIWKDTTFVILCVVTFMVIAMIICGTMYDLRIQKEKQNRNSSNLTRTPINNNNGPDVTSKLDVGYAEAKIGRKYSYGNNENENFTSNSTELPEDNRVSKPLTTKGFFVWLGKKAILSFSLRTNIKSICDQYVGSDTIAVIHGLKSISMAWVILGHTCIISFKYSDNMEYRKIVQKEFFFQTISNAAFSVDTFFFTSGLLVSFLYFRSNAKGKLESPYLKYTGFTKAVIRFFGLIVYRFARLSAPYLFVLGLVEVTMKWFYYNSIFEPAALDHVNCPQYWWRNILYINTLFPVEEMCMLWSWYISDDTQFYIVGAVVLILASSNFKSALALLIVFLLSSWTTTGYIAYSSNHMPGADDPLAHFDKIYDKPWTRLGPYLIGMCVGWILFKTECKIRMSKLTVAVGWLASTGCLVSLVYGLYEADLSPFAAAAYSSLSHSAWALGLAWIVIACTTGYGGYVNSILSSSILYPFSRVTYCTYLIHPIIIRMMTMTMDHPLHLGKAVMVAIYIGQVVVSFSIAFLISVAFEAPVVSLLRILPKFSSQNQRKS